MTVSAGLKVLAISCAPAPYKFGPKPLDDADDEVRNISQPGRVLFELPCALQALHGVCIIFCAEMALGAVFDDDEREGDTHDACR